MRGLTVEIVNYERSALALMKAGQDIALASVEVAWDEADFELGLSLQQVPVLTGALYGTGRLEDVPAEEGGQKTVAIAYGDEKVDYALAVHEDLEAYHPTGKAKYLEDPVREEMSSGRAVARMRAGIELILDAIGQKRPPWRRHAKIARSAMMGPGANR